MAAEKPPRSPGFEIPSLAPPAPPSRAGGARGPAVPPGGAAPTDQAARGELEADWLTQGSSVELGARSNPAPSARTHGELDIDWLTSQAVSPNPKGAASPSAASADFEADEFESFATGLQSLSLEGELPAEAPLPGLEAVDRRRALHAGALPTGCSPVPHELEVTPEEARAFAGYGETPPVYLAVPYAVRVHLRQRALRARLAELERELGLAEDQRDAALGSIVAPLRAKLGNEDRFRDLLARADAIAAEVAAARSRVSDVTDEHAQAMGRLAAERGTIEQELTARRTVEEAQRAAFERAEHDFRRLEARAKRLQIELRNARALEPPSAPPPQDVAQRVASAEAQLAALAPELDSLRASAGTARASAEAAQAERLGTELRLRVHDQQASAMQAQYSQASSAQVLSLRDAERRERTALADVTRAVLASELGRALDEASLELARTHGARVRGLALEVRRHVLALEAHDAGVLKAGHATVAVLAVSLAVLSVALIAHLL